MLFVTQYQGTEEGYKTPHDPYFPHGLHLLPVINMLAEEGWEHGWAVADCNLYRSDTMMVFPYFQLKQTSWGECQIRLQLTCAGFFICISHVYLVQIRRAPEPQYIVSYVDACFKDIIDSLMSVIFIAPASRATCTEQGRAAKVPVRDVGLFHIEERLRNDHRTLANLGMTHLDD